MLIIGEGLYPEFKRVIVRWQIEGRAETPIKIHVGFVKGELPANTDAVVPENIASMLEDSGYDVQIKGVAPAEYQIEQAGSETHDSGGADPIYDQALALIRQPLAALNDALAAGVPLAVLKVALDAEQADGGGKTRAGAVEALTKAIAAAPQT